MYLSLYVCALCVYMCVLMCTCVCTYMCTYHCLGLIVHASTYLYAEICLTMRTMPYALMELACPLPSLVPCGNVTEGHIDLLVLRQVRSVPSEVPQRVAKIGIETVVFALYRVGQACAVLLHMGEVDRERVPFGTLELLGILEVAWLSIFSCAISGEGAHAQTDVVAILRVAPSDRAHHISYSSRKVWNDFCTRSPSLSPTTAPEEGPPT